MRNLLLILLAILFSGTVTCFSQPRIIFDTDIGGDADDLGALAMLHNYVKNGHCELLAVMVWSNDENAVPAVDAINRYYLHPDIPIGVRKDGIYKTETSYNNAIAASFEYKLTYYDVPETTELYRKILASAADTSITIVSVGPMKNIERLIKSKADVYSNLSGERLIEKKVKSFVIMGGQFPRGKDEWNFNGNMPGVTKFVIESLKNLPVVFTGFELGSKIKTGAIFNTIDKETPLYQGFMHFSSHASWIKDQFKGAILNNSTFDQTAVLYAVNGGVGIFWDKISDGYCDADEKGGNQWAKKREGYNHSYLKLTQSPEFISALIEAIMLNRFDEIRKFSEDQ